jgi:hypothetical protein
MSTQDHYLQRSFNAQLHQQPNPRSLDHPVPGTAPYPAAALALAVVAQPQIPGSTAVVALAVVSSLPLAVFAFAYGSTARTPKLR